jgi:serine/threonine protein kinase
MAPFDPEEVICGRHLGTGAFCDVHEIEAFHTFDTGSNRFSESEKNNRNLLERNAKNNDARYVIKMVRPQMTILMHDFLIAAGDLNVEASILGKVEHRNIIKLHGHSARRPDDYFNTRGNRASFLILERLEGTLEDCLNEWKRQTHRLANVKFGGLFQSKRTKIQLQQLFVERLGVALEIASALDYLHGERIVYRDLKPANVGIDASNVCKLFDFGLARLLPTTKASDMKSTFQMTGKVGSIRYMAPEVYRRKPYNTKADVYSFALLLWEILALSKPFGDCTEQKYRSRVVKRGERPEIDSSWPLEIQELLRKTWSPSMDKRPTMKEVCAILKEQIAKLRDSDCDRQNKNDPLLSLSHERPEISITQVNV